MTDDTDKGDRSKRRRLIVAKRRELFDQAIRDSWSPNPDLARSARLLLAELAERQKRENEGAA